MTDKQTKSIIESIGRIIRNDIKKYMSEGERAIEINTKIPYIAIQTYPNTEYYFQGDEAQNLLNEAKIGCDKFNVTIEDYILYLASNW
jgi:hypothetical protein